MPELETEIDIDLEDLSTKDIVEEFEKEGKLLGTFDDPERAAEEYVAMVLGDLENYPDDDYDYPDDE